ncbi:hypothetical protein CCR94_08845 [Rhodoblastus sphagnicola]|uniref:Uncharacterized protein n=1 Tax=Rhodoblastus sphagnicola TaxID=333368 RepID=A0A2S6N9W1_9HYPH|nr:putative Ig domain-containing protein [Rhodoblastus sphagnicola]MBB4198770.1 hypothetical protein [Rhodoblastus sphagnicola]PPQ31405.1 hypothetical protein CCR94_08845 [Rhodoblastus sphagnicola]
MSANSSSTRNLFGQNDDSSAPVLPAFQAGTADWSALLFSAASAASATTAAGTGATTGVKTVVGATSTPPAWVNTLANAAIATDMKAALVNGAVTEPGLAKLMTDLTTNLGSGKLTASQFADLKTIAANLNTGVSTSAYLKYAFNALVNGNAANATWTGGNAASVALGNLAAGATATQVSELTGKWLLGTDLPSSSVVMGSTRFSVTESTVNKPLFATGGASMNDINQGYLGDCYFLSSAAEVVYQNASLVSSMFTDNGNGTYGVRLYENGVAQYVTVNSALANGGSIFNHASDLWASLAEKAFAQLQAGGVYTGNSVNYGNSYSTIGNGGNPIYGLEALTGAKVLQEFGGSSSGWVGYNLNASFSVTSYVANQSGSTLLNELIADLNAHDDVILCSYTNAYDSLGKQTLVAGHAMSIYGYDTKTGLLEVRNPWGSASGQYWNTTFEVSLATLQAAGDWIMTDSAGGALAPMLVSQTATQSFVKGKATTFSVAGAFVDPVGLALTYSATQANGTALPSWLSLNASTGVFSGAAPTTASAVSIVVTARDSAGLAASETISVAIASPAAPRLAAQTANQTVTIGKAVSLALSASTFIDPQGEALTYSATQGNGSALPTWLSFNAASRLFSGTAPSAAGTYALKVTATDTGGAAASETFNLTISSSAARVAGMLGSGSGGFFNPQPHAVDPAAVLHMLAPAA